MTSTPTMPCPSYTMRRANTEMPPTIRSANSVEERSALASMKSSLRDLRAMMTDSAPSIDMALDVLDDLAASIASLEARGVAVIADPLGRTRPSVLTLPSAYAGSKK